MNRVIQFFKVSSLKLFGFTLVVLLAMFALPVQASEKVTTVWVYDDVYRDYIQFLDGRDPLKIAKYDGAYARRDVIDLVLLQQLIVEGGADVKFKFVLGPYFLKRALNDLGKNFSLLGSPVFHKDVQGLLHSGLFKSEPMVRHGEFVVGVYMLEKHKMLNKIHSLSDLQGLTAICSSSWKADLALLKELGIKVVLAPSWAGVNLMLQAGRADFVLQPFQRTKDMSISAVEGIRLLPSQGIKVTFPSERLFVGVEKSVLDHEIMEALDKGIQKFRRVGRIVRAYKESGFFTPKVEDWMNIAVQAEQ